MTVRTQWHPIFLLIATMYRFPFFFVNYMDGIRERISAATHDTGNVFAGLVIFYDFSFGFWIERHVLPGLSSRCIKMPVSNSPATRRFIPSPNCNRTSRSALHDKVRTRQVLIPSARKCPVLRLLTPEVELRCVTWRKRSRAQA